MARYEETVPSVRTQQDTFDYLARFSNTQDWDPSARRGRDLQDGGPVGVGSRFELDFEIAGRVTELDYEVVEYEASPAREAVHRRRVVHQRVTTRSRWPPSGDGGAQVTYTAVVKMKGPLRPVRPDHAAGLQPGRSHQAAKGLRETLARQVVSRA